MEKLRTKKENGENSGGGKVKGKRASIELEDQDNAQDKDSITLVQGYLSRQGYYSL